MLELLQVGKYKYRQYLNINYNDINFKGTITKYYRYWSCRNLNIGSNISAEISIGMQSVANLTEIYRNWVIYVFVYQM